MTECPMMVAFNTRGLPKLLYCGKWSCKKCRSKNAKKWAAITRYGIRQLAKTGKKPLFWTFTLSSAYKTAKQGYEAIPRLWNTLRMEIQREQGKFTYLAFVEGQPKRGNMPHFHVIVFARVPTRYSRRKDPAKNIKDFAVHVGFGHQAKEERVTSGKAAAYVSKYVSKGTPDIPTRFHRVRCSQDWKKPPDNPHDAYIVRSIGEQISDYLLRVADASGRALDDLLEDYQRAGVTMTYERLTQ